MHTNRLHGNSEAQAVPGLAISRPRRFERKTETKFQERFPALPPDHGNGKKNCSLFGSAPIGHQTYAARTGDQQSSPQGKKEGTGTYAPMRLGYARKQRMDD